MTGGKFEKRTQQTISHSKLSRIVTWCNGRRRSPLIPGGITLSRPVRGQDRLSFWTGSPKLCGGFVTKR